MTTRPTEPVLWAEGTPPAIAGTNPPADPGSARRDSGYGYTEPIPHESFNWIHRTLGRWVNHFGTTASTFKSIPNAVATLAPGDTCILDLHNPAKAFAQALLSTVGVPDLRAIAVDGERVIYVRETNILSHYQYSGAGVVSWTLPVEVSAAFPNVQIFADGEQIIVGWRVVGGDRARVTSFTYAGVVNWSWESPILAGTSFGGFKVAQDHLFVQYQGGANPVIVRLDITTGVAFGTTYTAANISLKAVNSRFVFLAVGTDVVRVLNQALTLQYNTTAGTGGGGLQPNMAADEDSVFVVLDPDGEMVKYNIGIGELVEAARVPAAFGPVYLDHEFVYLGAPSSASVTLSREDLKQKGYLWSVATELAGFAFGTTQHIALDGESIWLGYLDGANWKIGRVRKNNLPEMWRRSSPREPANWFRQRLHPSKR